MSLDKKITPEMMLQAYAMGIFPMAENAYDDEMFWVDPEHRGILPINGFHISRSLAKRIRLGVLEARLNRDFSHTVSACSDRKETWINPTLHRLYTQLHQMGAAHALEVWENGQCLGGLFGITLGGAFFGESMYSAQKDGSKLALAFLTTHLHNCGFTLLDTQFVTDHLISLGAKEINRDTYLKQLETALQKTAHIMDKELPTYQDVLQFRTQTS